MQGLTLWVVTGPTDVPTADDVEALRASARRIADTTGLELMVDGVEVRKRNRFYETLDAGVFLAQARDNESAALVEYHCIAVCFGEHAAQCEPAARFQDHRTTKASTSVLDIQSEDSLIASS